MRMFWPGSRDKAAVIRLESTRCCGEQWIVPTPPRRVVHVVNLRLGTFRDWYYLGVPPQPIQVIVRSCFFRKHVDQIVAIIGQYPFGILESFDAYRILAPLREL